MGRNLLKSGKCCSLRVKQLAAQLLDFFYLFLSYSWDAPRLHLSAWSVCIPAELYLKAWSLHWLQECTSALRPHPLSLCLSPSTYCVQYLLFIIALLRPATLLPWNCTCANKYTRRRSRMRTKLVYHISKCCWLIWCQHFIYTLPREFLGSFLRPMSKTSEWKPL